MKYLLQLIVLNNHSKFYQLVQIRQRVIIFLVFQFFTTKRHHHSTKLVQDRISRIRNLLPIVPSPIKFWRSCSWQPKPRLIKIFLWAGIPFKEHLNYYIFIFRRIPNSQPRSSPISTSCGWSGTCRTLTTICVLLLTSPTFTNTRENRRWRLNHFLWQPCVVTWLVARPSTQLFQRVWPSSLLLLTWTWGRMLVTTRMPLLRVLGRCWLFCVSLLLWWVGKMLSHS